MKNISLLFSVLFKKRAPRHLVPIFCGRKNYYVVHIQKFIFKTWPRGQFLSKFEGP
jgi:hypothetical protein